MFESLSDRLNETFKKFKGQGRLDENNIKAGLREVRLALLEADVNFKVVKDFVARIQDRAVGEDVLKSLTPGQQVVKIVHEELIELLGGEQTALDLRGATPGILMMVGLQGSGKTTSTAKLALHLRKQKLRPLMVPADVYRPAAIDQLKALGKQLDMPVFDSSTDMNPVDIARQAVELAKAEQYNVVLLDTAGRLHIDETLMGELKAVKAEVAPQEILFVADAMSGQDAVTVAEQFNSDLDITGVVLTKMDGDARGGAALSIKSVTGKPVKFVGVGEKLSELELFHPDRMAGRILGMGDMLTLIEKAQGEIAEEEAEALAKKMQKAEFDFEDFRTQMRRLKKLGSLENILKMIPGMGGLRDKLGDLQAPEKEMGRVEAIINSMTNQERRQPALLNTSRKKRIARGSGVELKEVNDLLVQFDSMRKMMSQMMGGGKKTKKGGFPKLPGMGGGMGGGLPKGVENMSEEEALQAMQGMGPGMGGMGGLPGMPGMGGEGRQRPKSAATKSQKNKRKDKKRKKKR